REASQRGRRQLVLREQLQNGREQRLGGGALGRHVAQRRDLAAAQQRDAGALRRGLDREQPVVGVGHSAQSPALWRTHSMKPWNLRARSFQNASAISMIRAVTPTCCTSSRVRTESGERLILSTAISNAWPPSSTGIGSRFRIPRLMLISASVDRKSSQPRSNALCAISAIPI